MTTSRVVEGRGIYHPSRCCAYCGARSSPRLQLRLATVLETTARALVCCDVIACMRRRSRRAARERYGLAA